MGSSRETFTGKRLEPTRALILGMAGSSSVAQQGGRRLPLTRLLLGKKPGVPKPHPEAICAPGPEPRSLCAAAASAAGPALGPLSPGERGALCLGGWLGAVVCAAAETSSRWIPSSSGSCL